MPIKIFSAPGDHRDDFQNVEKQVNEWSERTQPNIIDLHCCVNQMPEKRDLGGYLLTVVVRYE
jgi:hypothetical protein